MKKHTSSSQSVSRFRSRPRRLASIAAAGVVTLVLVVGVPGAMRTTPASSDSGARTPPSGSSSLVQPSSIAAAAEGAAVSVEVSPNHPVFAVAELPPGFELQVNELSNSIADGSGTPRTYMAFTRGEDPDTSEDWGVIRIRVVYRPFDATSWINAYADLSEEESAAGRHIERIAVGHNTNALIEHPETPDSGLTVLRFGDNDVQIMITGTRGVTPDELQVVADGIMEVSR